MDCLITPGREASLSSESIIHVGKSTFTLFRSLYPEQVLVRCSLTSIHGKTRFLTAVHRNAIRHAVHQIQGAYPKARNPNPESRSSLSIPRMANNLYYGHGRVVWIMIDHVVSIF